MYAANFELFYTTALQYTRSFIVANLPYLMTAWLQYISFKNGRYIENSGAVSQCFEIGKYWDALTKKERSSLQIWHFFAV